MPFTGSHVAAVLPVVGVGLPVSALVVGSMSPDLPYYAPQGPWMAIAGGGATHSLAGVVLWAPLWGLAVLALWHGLVARPAVAAAPEALRRRLPAPATLRDRMGSPRLLGLTYLALVLGALTHVAWDAFTHEGRWGAEHLAFLESPVTWLPFDRPGYAWAQEASTVLGLAVLAWWLARWWRRTPPATSSSEAALSPATRRNALAAVAGVGVIAGSWVALRHLHVDDGLGSTAFHAITRGVAAASAVTLVLALVWTLTLGRDGQAR